MNKNFILALALLGFFVAYLCFASQLYWIAALNAVLAAVNSFRYYIS